jgi:hypothetical protein
MTDIIKKPLQFVFKVLNKFYGKNELFLKSSFFIKSIEALKVFEILI